MVSIRFGILAQLAVGLSTPVVKFAFSRVELYGLVEILYRLLVFAQVVVSNTTTKNECAYLGVSQNSIIVCTYGLFVFPVIMKV